MNKLDVSSAVIMETVAIKLAILLNLSTHTNIASCPCIVGVSLVIKSRLTHSHFLLGISKGCNNHVVLVVEILLR